MHAAMPLPIQQLQQLKERLTNELNQYARSGNQLALAAGKFEESRESVQALAQTKEGEGMGMKHGLYTALHRQDT